MPLFILCMLLSRAAASVLCVVVLYHEVDALRDGSHEIEFLDSKPEHYFYDLVHICQVSFLL